MRGGTGDLFDYYGELQPAGASYGQVNLETWLGTTPWRDMPRAISTIRQCLLDRVSTPLLIIHGENSGAGPTIQWVNDLC